MPAYNGNGETTWQEISIRGHSGWVTADYIALETQAPASPTPLAGAVRQTQSANAIDYAKFSGRSYDAVIRDYDPAGNVIETYEHPGHFREP